MGSGKSVLADAVSSMTGLRSIDLDAAIVSDAGKTIPEIFMEQGEPFFRELESNVLYDVHRLENLIVATGGGIVLQERNVELMRHSGLVVYIQRAVDDIIASIDAASRPLLSANSQNVRRIYEERRTLYEHAAMITVDNVGTIEDAALKIIRKAGLTATSE